MARRGDADLTFAGPADIVGTTLLLDTTVYIDVLEGSTPPEVDAILQMRPLAHVSVVLAELSHNFGRLNPAHPDTPATLRALAAVINDLPLHRVEDNISAGVMLEAGILAGLMYRLGGLQPGRELAALNDAAVFLHALEQGHTVLTRNIRDFDLMQQIVPAGRVLFYRVV